MLFVAIIRLYSKSLVCHNCKQIYNFMSIMPNKMVYLFFASPWLVAAGYFRKMKYTARTRHAKPARWFQRNGSPLTKSTAKRVNTTSEITS